MNKKDSLGDRMKTYESVTRTYLTCRTPVIIRLDGKAFHTFTRNFKKPFDDVLSAAMQKTMTYLCENIEGCILGYTQSDEITLVLCDYKNITTQPWFGNNIQKICSVSASMATMAFNKFFKETAIGYITNKTNDDSVDPSDEKEKKYITTLQNAINKGALFDSRVFNIPKEEVNNCLVWRQQDAIRNSIEAVAQANFSHKQLEGKSCIKLQEMLLEIGIDWHVYPLTYQRGSCCVKMPHIISPDITRMKWVIDNSIPIFSQSPCYVLDRVIL